MRNYIVTIQNATASFKLPEVPGVVPSPKLTALQSAPREGAFVTAPDSLLSCLGRGFVFLFFFCFDWVRLLILTFGFILSLPLEFSVDLVAQAQLSAQHPDSAATLASFNVRNIWNDKVSLFNALLIITTN